VHPSKWLKSNWPWAATPCPWCRPRVAVNGRRQPARIHGYWNVNEGFSVLRLRRVPGKQPPASGWPVHIPRGLRPTPLRIGRQPLNIVAGQGARKRNFDALT